jgi:acyl-CoA dehydrogenase
MLDFSLSEEQKILKETAKRFAEKEIRPVVKELDRILDPAAGFPWEVVKKGNRLGFGKLLIPKEYGGYGGSLFDYALLLEALAYGDTGIAHAFMNNNSLGQIIALIGNEAQKEKWLRPLCDDDEGDFIIAGAITEPSGGTEVFCMLPDPKLGVRTTAHLEGNEYVINGQKNFVSFAGLAKLYCVMARTDQSKPNVEGCNLFYFFADTPGMTVGKIEDQMGHRTARVAEVFFENMRLPKENMLEKPGEGLQTTVEMYKSNGVGAGAMAIGLAQAAYDEALRYAKERISWGQPLIQHQAIGMKLAEMRMQIEAARSLVYRAIWAIEHPEESGELSKIGPTMAKVYPTSLVRNITIEALQVLGGYGFMKDFPVEKYVRDSMVMPIYDGANEVLKLAIASDL